jgi:hypothetical protein
MASLHALTTQPGHWFFGYYGTCPWDRAGRRHLALHTDFADRLARPGEQARVVVIDADTGAATDIARTAAFNFQQGAMLHWIDVGLGEEALFNDWHDGRVVSTAVDPATGRRRMLDGGVTDVCASRRLAVGLDFARLWHCRRIVGYANEARAPLDPMPRDDGLHLVDLVSGQRRLLLSLPDLVRGEASPWRDQDVQCAWIDHAYFNRSGDALAVFVRVRQQDQRRTAVMLVDVDRRSARLIVGPDERPAHMAWRDDDSFILACQRPAFRGFHLFHRDGREPTPFAPASLPQDGHPSFAPDGRRLVTDTLPQGERSLRQLLLLNLDTQERQELGPLASAEPFRGDVRCDLHPRWSRDGRWISIDSSHESRRMIYLIHVDR